MKKTNVFLAAGLCLALLTGCSESNDLTKVGVVQFVSHEALDQSREGFINALAEEGFVDGENIELELANAQSDHSSLASISSELASDSDLILAIGTSTAQQVAQETSTIPIIGAAITDYEAAGLVESNEQPNTNVTGVSDFSSYEKQAELIRTIFPEATRLGIMYTSSEINSETQAKEMERIASEMGFEVTIKTVADATVINDTMTSFAGAIDVLYVPTDNILSSAMPSVTEAASQIGVPVIAGEFNQVSDGALASLGVNYEALGEIAGHQAAAILRGESTPANMPIQYQEELTIYYNSQTASRLGITLPEEITSQGVDLAA